MSCSGSADFSTPRNRGIRCQYRSAEPAFEAMLAAWLTDPAGWPREWTFEMFQEWFEIQMASVVEDLYIDESTEALD